MFILSNDELYLSLQKGGTPEELRSLLFRCEERLKEIIGDDPTHFFCGYVRKEIEHLVYSLFRIRQMILDEMFTWSDREVAMIKETNSLLLGLSVKMYERTANLYRSVIKNDAEADFDDDYNVDGQMLVSVCYDPGHGDYGTVNHFDNDGYYGSDFAYMIDAIANFEEEYHSAFHQIHDCHICHNETNHPDMSNEELDCDYHYFDDGHSWRLTHSTDVLDHICICHALYSLNQHHRYSLPDILRINSYTVEAQITCQHITDSKHRNFNEIRNEW